MNMATSAALLKNERRVRLGLIGGGGNGLICPVHRVAAQFDGHIELVAGVLSSYPEQLLAAANELRLPRGYLTVADMSAGEASRSDAVDAVAIAIPNDSHAEFAELALRAGLDVICDKPITNGRVSARRIASLVAETAGWVDCETT